MDERRGTWRGRTDGRGLGDEVYVEIEGRVSFSGGEGGTFAPTCQNVVPPWKLGCPPSPLLLTK